MVVDGKDMKNSLAYLDLPGGKYKIGHNVIKVVDNKIGPIIRDVDYKEINQNSEDGLLLMLEKYIDM